MAQLIHLILKSEPHPLLVACTWYCRLTFALYSWCFQALAASFPENDRNGFPVALVHCVPSSLCHLSKPQNKPM